MKNIILISMLVLIPVLFGAGAYNFTAYTLDKTTTIWTVAPVESVFVVRYDDDGVTKVDSGYTDAWGHYTATSKFRNDQYERVHATKTNYSFGQDGWTRFFTTNFDSTSDITTVPLRAFLSPTDSTITISFTLVNSDMSPNTNTTVYCYSAAPFKGTAGSILSTTTNANDAVQTATPNANGLVEFTVAKYSSCYIKVGSQNITGRFTASANVTLAKIIFDPN